MKQANEPDDAERLWDGREGYLAGIDGEDRAVVDFEGNPAAPLAALATAPMRGAALEAAVTSRQRVQLRFHDSAFHRPVIIGLSQEAPQGGATYGLRGKASSRLDVQENTDGVTLRVGKASLQVVHDGRIFLKGTYV